MTRVRVGIVSWNTADLLAQCLDALPAALDGLDADVVVVDNASSDTSREVAESRGITVIANDTNVGYARAMNQALEVSPDDVEVLIALNPDTVPGPASLERLCATLLADDDVALVVPRLTYPDGSLQHSCYRFPSLRVAAGVSFLPRWILSRGIGQRLWLEGHSPHDRNEAIDWAIGAVHVIRRAALDGTAPYSERWFMYAEDLELCWRLASNGWERLLCAEITIPHVSNASGAQAWGEDRTAQWLAATHDWYELARGRMAARLWALLNVFGVSWLGLVHAVLAIPRTRRRRFHADLARQMLYVLPLHVRAFFGGARRLVDAADHQRAARGVGEQR